MSLVAQICELLFFPRLYCILINTQKKPESSFLELSDFFNIMMFLGTHIEPVGTHFEPPSLSPWSPCVHNSLIWSECGLVCILVILDKDVLCCMNLFLNLCRDGSICVGIVAKYKQLFITECSGICVNLRMIWNQYVIHTVHHNFVCMAKCNQLFIISKNRIWIVYLCGCVDCFVVFIYLQPWCA